ncbi:MAG TPA: Ppx/GppA family phosphatase [Bdellovibrionota bacterium]|jgi:exopolyphosphatase/guanosine-5'-triphosphate,3'-diphosphate pyrophosphatase|nr:Ppx/GppA family phosphatase [Bdellovibrionota bacterium]
MLRSSIDLGTNTCLLLVTDWDSSSRLIRKVVDDRAEIVRLGQGVDRDRRLHPEAMERTLSCLKTYSTRLKELGGDPGATVAVATSQARDAANGVEFFQRVERETGFRFRVISGDEEARASFRGALLPGMDPGRSAVIDIGGGSTELVTVAGGLSIDMGSVRFSERFLKSDPVTDAEFWACRDAVDTALEKASKWKSSLAPGLQLVAVAGTATTLAAAFLGQARFDAAAIDQVTLSRGDCHRLVEELKWRKVSERAAMPGIDARRADVILAGALILWRSLERLGFESCRVSTRGLRYGVLLTDS